jgi:energy-coupling factor transporter ATP-binding protein EcfA2
MKLSQAIAIKSRFSSSINLERDSVKGSLSGYVPTGRALDVVRRLAHGLADPTLGRSISITGPHGGGKSSLAVFIDGLVSASSSEENRIAVELLKEFDPELAENWTKSVKSIGGANNGFFKAVVTANREPILASLVRALKRATDGKTVPESAVYAKIQKINEEADLDPNVILKLAKELASIKPILFVVDEFGKNLEAYVDSPAKGDPYILQALSELGQGREALPIFIITLQHLSFDEYVQGTTVGQRREWAKIQGRFQDIPFIESALQSRRLIASVFEQKDATIKTRYKSWLFKHESLIASAGLSEISKSSDTVKAYPLDPLTLAVLPPLCSRYGQNERTLFSFLASKEKSSVASYMEGKTFSKTEQLEFIGLDRVYDYFLESASTLLATSTTASRWLEIETRIRDAQGLSSEELKVLKAIGILNLISSGGSLRATRSIVKLSLADADSTDVQLEKKAYKILTKLEDRGLIVYRAFADEFRIWQGSDFDLRTAVEIARKSLTSTPLHILLNEVADLSPVVAAKVSQEKGVLRVFEQVFADLNVDSTFVSEINPHIDGVVVFSTTSDVDLKKITFGEFEKPVVVLMPQNLDLLKDIAIEVTAIHKVLNQNSEQTLDWVARKELVERYVVVRQKLQEVISTAWLTSSNWLAINPMYLKLDSKRGLSAALSAVTEQVFSETPKVSNEMIARRELTGQGAKARRTLLEAIRTSPNEEFFGIQGFGPDRAIYEAIFRSTGMHKSSEDGRWFFAKPAEPSWAKVWDLINSGIDGATKNRISLAEIQNQLTKAPYGLKEGILPLISFAVISSRRNDLAIYEHGTLILDLDEAVLERLSKNPFNFTIRNYALDSTSRTLFLNEVVNAFSISNVNSDDTFIQIIKALYREMYAFNPYTKRTKDGISASTLQIRSAFTTASEPDRLLFEQVPEIFGAGAIFPDKNLTKPAAKKLAQELSDSFRELKSAYPNLLNRLKKYIAEATATSTELELMRKQLEGQAANLEGRVLDKSLQTFVVAIQRKELSNQEWLENLAMVTLDGSPARSWGDDEINSFALRIYQIGGALKRLQSLLYDRLSRDETPFEAIRITLTHPDGSEDVNILSITQHEKQQISEAMAKVIGNIESMFGSNSAAKSALMAWLASAPEDAQKQLQNRGEKQSG